MCFGNACLFLCTEVITHIDAREFWGISRQPGTSSGTSVALYEDVSFDPAAKQQFVCDVGFGQHGEAANCCLEETNRSRLKLQGERKAFVSLLDQLQPAPEDWSYELCSISFATIEPGLQPICVVRSHPFVGSHELFQGYCLPSFCRFVLAAGYGMFLVGEVRLMAKIWWFSWSNVMEGKQRICTWSCRVIHNIKWPVLPTKGTSPVLIWAPGRSRRQSSHRTLLL